MTSAFRSDISRRLFLASTAAFAATPAFAALPSSGETDIVIVGAGAAGIAAARRVMAAGRRCIVLEASDRVGGRCVTDTRFFNAPCDLGAHWMHLPDVNPLVKLAPGTGLDIYRAPGDQRVRIGRRYAREGEAEDFLAAFVRANRAVADAARKGDVAAAAALPKDLGEWQRTVEFVLGPFHSTKDLAEVSALDLSRAVDRDADSFCRQGYGALLARVARGLPVELSTPVKKIEWARTLQVQTDRGTVSARAVIVTVSTSVIAANRIAFSPALPRRQLDAVSKLKLGSFERVVLELADNPMSLRADELVFEKADDEKTAVLLANVADTEMNYINVGGNFGRDLSAKGEAALIDFGKEWLAGLYGADIKKSVKRALATQWDKNPWVLGATSIAAPGAQGARRILTEPVRDNLFFAGEATHEAMWGTVNGAWASGERAAEAALRRIGALKTGPAPAEKPERQPRAQRQRQPQRPRNIDGSFAD